MKNKKIVISLIIVFVILLLGIFIGGIIFTSKIKVYEGENDYEIVIYNNKKIFFLKDDFLQTKLDTRDFLKDVHYGYVDCPIAKQDESLDCESTTEFFELYLKDKGLVLLVDDKGNILSEEKDSACKERGSDDFEFYCNYWYVNYKVSDSKNDYYIQETYDSEGSSWFKILRKNKTGVFSSISEVEGFYIGKKGLLEYNENQFKFYKGDKLEYKSRKFDKIFDIYEDTYVLVKDDNEVKVFSNVGNKVVEISFDKKINDATIEIINDKINISVDTYDKDIQEYQEVLYTCDVNGKCLKDSEGITYDF